MMMESIRHFNEKGYFHGYSETYWDNGNFCYKGNYHNGKQVGYWEFHFEKGGLKRKEFYL